MKRQKSALTVFATICHIFILPVIATFIGSMPVMAQAVQTMEGRQNQQQQTLPQPKKRPSPKPQVTAEEISEARQLLHSLGYIINTEAIGLDASLRHALTAFQKIEGRTLTGVLTTKELNAIRKAQRPAPLESGDPHIEIDINRQVLFIVDLEGEVSGILPVSTGSGEWFTNGDWTRQAITPVGRYKVEWKVNGWRKSPLGSLYYPAYIYKGVAIHGHASIPTKPSSHGCIRIPMFASKQVYKTATIGMTVIVYDSGKDPQETEVSKK